jgi:aspartate-semialdehyde dehydrogenase
LIIPEINEADLEILKEQKFGKGKIVTVPNCSVVGLCLALKPLLKPFGLQAVHVVTLQAISGAGLPGVPSLQIVDNVIPFIADEEKKLQEEPKKILALPDLKISAQCNRVPVTDGHLECISVKLKNKPSPAELINAWQNFKSFPQEWLLPSAPIQPVHYFEEENYPQPKLHRSLDKSMRVSIGRLRECELLDYKFVLLSHNTIRGAAGGAILTAELCLKSGHIFW